MTSVLQRPRPDASEPGRGASGGPQGARGSVRPPARRAPVGPGSRAHPFAQLALAPLLFVVLILPLGGLAALLSGSGWWYSTAFVVAVVLAVAAVARLLPVPSFVPSLAALLAWAFTVTALFAPSEALFGFVPTFDTVRSFREGLRQAGESISLQSVPADPVVPIVLLLALTVGLLALVADGLVFAVRMPALAGLVSLSIFAVPYAVLQLGFDIWLFVWSVTAFLLLVWFADRLGVSLRLRQASIIRAGRSPLRAVVGGTLALVLAVVLPAVTPGLMPGDFRVTQQGQLPSVYSSGVDPSIQLSQDLRRTNPILSLTYTSTSTTGLYLKLVNLSDFGEGPWQPESTRGARPLQAGFDAPDGLGADIATTTVTSQVSITGLRSDWLPVPYPATGVDGVVGSWTVTPESLAVTGVETNSSGQNYTVTSLAVQPTAAQLAASGTTVPDALTDYLRLPGDIAPIITETAQQVAGGQANNYAKAIALQQYFTSGQFQYSVTAPVQGDYDGGNFAAVAKFLEVKSGYCIHFASSMAVMARELGIPARIAIGYHPGGPGTAQAGGLTKYTVVSDQLHAWPELWFAGIGWLPFEPTPGLGLTVPEYTTQTFAAAPAGTPATTAPTSSAAPTTPQNAPELAPETTAEAQSQALAAQQNRAWLGVIAALVVVALLLATPVTVRRLRRRRRYDRMLGDAPDPASIAWHELIDTARDHRIEIATGDTARGFADRLTALYRMPEPSVLALLTAVEREWFAPAGSASADSRQRTLLAGHLRTVITAIGEQSSPSELQRARLLPASLLPAWARGLQGEREGREQSR